MPRPKWCIQMRFTITRADNGWRTMASASSNRPLPFENADRYVALLDKHTESEGGGFGAVDYVPIAPATYFDWKKQAKSFDRITAYSWDEVNLTGDNEPQKIQAMHVAANFFETIGVPILTGRGFLATDTSATPRICGNFLIRAEIAPSRAGSSPAGATTSVGASASCSRSSRPIATNCSGCG